MHFVVPKNKIQYVTFPLLGIRVICVTVTISHVSFIISQNMLGLHRVTYRFPKIVCVIVDTSHIHTYSETQSACGEFLLETVFKY
jgi:hypothetical protein